MQQNLVNLRDLLALVASLLVVFGTRAEVRPVLGVQIPEVGRFRDCRPNVDCQLSTPKCSPVAPQIDSRDCNVCLVRLPFNSQCAARGNDPVCEASKAAQNAIYNADANLRRADCQRLEAQSKMACEATKEQQRQLCETAKSSEDRAARGNLAAYNGLIKLSADFIPSRVDERFYTRVCKELHCPKPIRVDIYLFSGDSYYEAALRYFQPKMYANEKSVPETRLPGVPKLRAAGTSVFLQRGQDFTIGDLVRSTITAVFFDALGIEGLAEIQSSGKFDLVRTIEQKLAPTCEAIAKDGGDVSCDTVLRLNPVR